MSESNARTSIYTMSALQEPTCNCCIATIRIINQSKAPFLAEIACASVQETSAIIPLSDLLGLGRNLIQ